MAVAGSLTYSTDIDKKGFEKGLNSLKNSTNTVGGQIKSIVAALGIDKLISATFNLLNNSIDGAISRLDTLNNYPKVMSNLGIASEDAQKSITKMSDKLSGLPTTLDEGALAVQRFTSKNSDVAKSTDYFLALNNALLAGGAGADIQSSALEQLSQAYSKGKPDMMEWRTLMTAMPAQLNQVAKAMGYVSTDKLGEDLRNGKVSMDKFMDTIVKLNTEGISGFQSFEEQAKNSTGGIATSIKVAKTQVVKGVADIIKSIDQILKDNGSGVIAEIIASLGKKAKEVLDIIAEKLPQIIESIKTVAPIIQKLLPAILSITSAIIAFKMALAIQNTVSKAIESLNKLFTVIMANPVVLIIAAIAALIAILAVLYKKNESFRNTVNESFKLIKETILNAWNTIKPLLEKLWVSVKQIYDASKPFLDYIVKGLNIAIPILAKWYSFLISVITKLAVVVINLWIVVINTGAKIITFLKEFKNFIINTFNNIIDFVKGNWQGLLLFIVNPFAGAFKLLYDNCEVFRNFINNFIESIQQFFINAWNNIISFFTEVIPNFINSLIQWFSNLPYMIEYYIGLILGNIVQFGINVWKWITSDLPKIIEGIVKWFAELPDRIWKWLLDVVEKIKNWGQNIYTTARNWTSSTINSIVSYFSQLPGRIWTWLQSTINNVVNFGRNMAQRGREGAVNLFNNIVNTLRNLPSQMWNVGRNIVEGLWNGIKGMGSWIKGKIQEFGRGLLDGMKKSLGIQSPSTLFRDEVGKFIPQGVAVGVEADTDKALRAINDMNNDIMSEMNRAVAFETGSINANASVKSNNSMLNVIQASFNIDGSIDIDGERAGRILTPYMTKNLRTAGVY